VSDYEAALNRLKEERLAVRDIREAILADEDLRASDPAHRRQLLAQTLLELAQLGRAIDLLTGLQSGDLVVTERADVGVAEVDRPDVPDVPRQTGLIRRCQPALGVMAR
jgi:hypothetical protein